MFAVARPPTVDTINVHDLGPMNIHCPFCDALHWKEERKKKLLLVFLPCQIKLLLNQSHFLTPQVPERSEGTR